MNPSGIEIIRDNPIKTNRSGCRFVGTFTARCFDPFGNLKWTNYGKNLVVFDGINHILDILFASGTQEATWYVGLTAATPVPANADTMASHGGWTEFSDYSEWTTRQTFTDARTNQTVDNTGNEAAFSIDTNGSSIGGAFLTSDVSGTAGVLLCCSAFTLGNKAADSGDTLQVDYQFDGSDAG